MDQEDRFWLLGTLRGALGSHFEGESLESLLGSQQTEGQQAGAPLQEVGQQELRRWGGGGVGLRCRDGACPA